MEEKCKKLDIDLKSEIDEDFPLPQQRVSLEVMRDSNQEYSSASYHTVRNCVFVMLHWGERRRILVPIIQERSDGQEAVVTAIVTVVTGHCQTRMCEACRSTGGEGEGEGEDEDEDEDGTGAK
ncbi:hypothetical protein E4U21_007082 [Claviceps maximensis]|nr:hypothetical protein E4U21_007082 [Claviceps maximensis]